MAEDKNEKGNGKIFAQMAKILKDATAITKDQENTQQRYKFRGIDDVYNSLHEIFAKHGVFTLPTVLEEKSEIVKSQSGKNMIYRVLRIVYRFFADDGSSISSIVVGEGMDFGDKAANKAMSAAHKYALLQTFLIPTDEPKDSEVDSPEIGNGNGSKKAGKPAEKRAEKPPEPKTEAEPKKSSMAQSEEDFLAGAKPPTKFDTAVSLTIGGKRKKLSYGEALEKFKAAKKFLGNADYYKVLGDLGFEKSSELPFNKLDEAYLKMIDKYNERREDFGQSES